MTRLRAALPIALSLLIAFALSYGIAAARLVARVAVLIDEAVETAELEPPSTAPRPEHPVDWIVAGGGPAPAWSQVQLEQDLSLASAVFGATGQGTLLFSGGPDSRAVQVLSDRDAADPLLERIGEIFDPRPGRRSIYRRTHLAPEGPATAERILDALGRALATGREPLTVYLAGHGAGGEAPRDSHFLTWGTGALWVEDLATVLDAAPMHRVTRVVITSCRAGGFAEIAFHHGDPAEGAAQTDRCGFFATTWDRDASGCDSNPDRGSQEGYGIHFLYALQQRDRADEILDARFDLDHDGAMSLLEAHTVARIESGSLDVPVTTSETFLRSLSLASTDPFVDPELPEEALVIAMLGERLGAADAAEVSRQLDTITAEMEPTSDELDALAEEIETAEASLRAALLHRWPVLDDPFHPDFATTLAEDRDAIVNELDHGELAQNLDALIAERDALGDQHDDLLIRATPLLRLERSHETIELAGRLKARGDANWIAYQRFLACERGGLPPMRVP